MRRQEAPSGEGPARRPRDPRRKDHGDADDDRGAGDLHQQRGGHRVGIVGSGFDRSVGGDRRDELTLPDFAPHEHDQAGEHKAPAHPHQRTPAMPASEEHRQRVERDHEDGQQQGQRVQRFGEIAHQPKLTRGDHLQIRHRRGQLVGDARGQAETLGEFGDDLVQVERDRAALDLHAASVAVDDRDQHLVGRAVGALPRVLHPRDFQRPFSALFGQVVQPSRDWACERRELLR